MSAVKELFNRHKSLLIILIVITAYYLQHLISFRLGISYEESRDANAYLLAMRGYLPYRDFEWLYGPFSFFIYPLIMRLFGISLVVLRLSYIIFASLVIPLSYFLAKRIMPCFWAGIAAFLSIVFFDVPYYAFNHVFAVLGLLACLLLVFRFMEENQKKSNLFWAGIFAAVTLLTKPLLLGASLFIAVSLLLFLIAGLGPLAKRLKDYSAFASGVVLLLSIFFLYFYFQTSFKNLPITYPYLARDSLIIIQQLHEGYTRNIGTFLLLLKRLKDLLPLAEIISASSLTEIKQLAVNSFDNFIYFLPYMVSTIILFVYLGGKFNKFRPELKKKLLLDKNYLLAFVIFSIFIPLESLKSYHNYSRAYHIQVPFILIVYLLYFIKHIYTRRRVITITLISLFLFSLSYLHFFRYPYSLIKKYTEPLNLERARGICLSLAEKELYESLTAYLSTNFADDDTMAVTAYGGCYSQFSFLTKRRNVFEHEEFIFIKLNILLNLSKQREDMRSLLVSLEDKIISTLEKEKTGIVLIITCDYFPGLEGCNFLSPRIKDYLAKDYSLNKVFGPADIHGLGGCLGWVSLFKLKER